MNYLIGVTLLWSFSFSLIGVYLAGQVDAYFSVLTRIVLASLVFLPFLRRRWLRPDLVAKLMALGAIQLGIMYLFYYHSFLLLTLFGASPAICTSFVEGREHELQKLSEYTLYLPHATSLRMSDLGYRNRDQAGVSVSANSLPEYIRVRASDQNARLVDALRSLTR